MGHERERDFAQEGPHYLNIKRLLHAVGDGWSPNGRRLGERWLCGRRIQETDPMILGDVCGSWLQLFMPSEIFASVLWGPGKFLVLELFHLSFI